MSIDFSKVRQKYNEKQKRIEEELSKEIEIKDETEHRKYKKLRWETQRSKRKQEYYDRCAVELEERGHFILKRIRVPIANATGIYLDGILAYSFNGIDIWR
jgi:hypothetical protein